MRVPTALLVFAVFAALVACATPASAPASPLAQSLSLTSPPPTATAVTEATPSAAVAPAQAPDPSPTPAPSLGSAPPPVPELTRSAMDFLTTFTEQYSPRTSVTQQEREAAEFLATTLEEMGYEVRLQPFTVETLPPNVPLISVDAPEIGDIQATPMRRTGTGEATGPLVHVGKAFPQDIPPEGLEGRIALIQRGDITFTEKVTRVAEAGAVAAVVYNNESGLFRGELSEQASIPAVSVSMQTGEELRSLLESRPVEATVSVVVQARRSQNVIAEKPGTGAGDRVVVLGGHYDTVSGVPGATDNGSGIASLITVARQMADEDYPFTLRFIGFGAEEIGLVGSRHYVDSLDSQERSNIVGMLNFDALGSGSSLYVNGDLGVIPELLGYAQEHGMSVERGSLGRGSSSDHASFQAADIPVVFFVGNDTSQIHTPDDTLANVDPELLGYAAALGIQALDLLPAQQPPD